MKDMLKTTFKTLICQAYGCEFYLFRRKKLKKKYWSILDIILFGYFLFYVYTCREGLVLVAGVVCISHKFNGYVWIC